MPEQRVPDATLMARLQLSVKGVDWAASLVQPYQHRHPPSGGWTAHQNVAHLLASETNVFHARIARMLAEEEPVMPPFDGDAWMVSRYDPSKDITELAEEFMAARAQTWEMLKPLEAEQWLRGGTWGDAGVHDIAWAAERALAHALEHFVALLNLHQAFEPRQAPRWLGQG